MAEITAPPITDRVTLEEAGEAHLRRLRSLGRKRSTIEGYESFLRIHLAPYLRGKAMAQISRADVQAYIDDKRESGQAVKSVRDHVGLLHGIFELSIREGRCASDPCKLVEKPVDVDVDADVRFLDTEELEALLRAVPDDDLSRVDRAMYLAAAMSGLRQGKLLALRWRDIDWSARRDPRSAELRPR